jgi:peptide deformylase
MSLLKIARMGHPVLRQAALAIADPTDLGIRRLADDMVETMLDAPGVGLAAPQVHESVRLIVFRQYSKDEAGEKTEEIVRLVNPVIEPVGEEILHGLEGCLSIPELRGLVPRFKTIIYRGFTPEGEAVEREASHFNARIVQHEADHLDGILYLDRMPDLTRLVYPEHVGRLNEEL